MACHHGLAIDSRRRPPYPSAPRPGRRRQRRRSAPAPRPPAREARWPQRSGAARSVLGVVIVGKRELALCGRKQPPQRERARRGRQRPGRRQRQRRRAAAQLRGPRQAQRDRAAGRQLLAAARAVQGLPPAALRLLRRCSDRSNSCSIVNVWLRPRRDSWPLRLSCQLGLLLWGGGVGYSTRRARAPWSRRGSARCAGPSGP